MGTAHRIEAYRRASAPSGVASITGVGRDGMAEDNAGGRCPPYRTPVERFKGMKSVES